MSFFEMSSETSAHFPTVGTSETCYDQRWQQDGNANFDFVDEGFEGFGEDGYTNFVTNPGKNMKLNYIKDET